MHAFVALYRGGVTQPNSPIIFDDAPRPGVSDPTPTLTRHRGPETHRQRRPAPRETHHDMPGNSGSCIAHAVVAWPPIETVDTQSR